MSARVLKKLPNNKFKPFPLYVQNGRDQNKQTKGKK